MGKAEIEAYLTHLAVSTQNQAFNALLFLHKQVLDLPFADDISTIRSKKTIHFPVMLRKKGAD